jgi:exopolysaccharide biosynthesis protein
MRYRLLLAMLFVFFLAFTQGAFADRSLSLSPIKGQMRLDGVLAGPLDSGAKSFKVLVYAVTMSTGQRQWLDPPRRKTIDMRVFSQFTILGSPTSSFGLYDQVTHPYHVVVMGSDDGPGTPLAARNVWVTPEGPAQLAYLSHMRSDSRREGSSQSEPDVRFSQETVDGLSISVVRVKLSTVRIKIGIADGQVGHIEPLGSIASHYGALAAINGSFFDAYDPGPVHMPDMPLVSGGLVLGNSNLGTFLGFSDEGEAKMAPANVALSLHERNPDMPVDLTDPDKDLFWERVDEGVGCGPRLVTDGQVQIDAFSEGITSDEVLSGTAIRSAVGLTKDGWMLLVVTRPATLSELAQAMRSLGAYQAMNLDGGSSTGLWMHGHTVVSPGRWLSNALLVLKK